MDAVTEDDVAGTMNELFDSVTGDPGVLLLIPVENSPERDAEVKLALGEVPGRELVPLLAGAELVAGALGADVWTVILMLMVLVKVCVNVTVESLVVSVQVVVQTEVELASVTGEPGVLELTEPVTLMN